MSLVVFSIQGPDGSSWVLPCHNYMYVVKKIMGVLVLNISHSNLIVRQSIEKTQAVSNTQFYIKINASFINDHALCIVFLWPCMLFVQSFVLKWLILHYRVPFTGCFFFHSQVNKYD